MHRREMIKSGAGAAFMMLVSAVNSAEVLAKPHQTTGPFFIEADALDPVLRASTLDLRIKDFELGKYIIGKGGVVSYQGVLGLLTVNHVIQKRQELTFQIPGHPVIKMDDDILKACQDQAGPIDQAVFMPLPKDYANIISELAKANIISPLSLNTSKVGVGETFAQPNTSIGYDLLTVTSIYPQNSEIRFKSPSFVPICKGKSGTPILRVSGSQIIPEVVGVVKSFPINTRLNEDVNSYEYNCGLSINAADTNRL